ncbi:succinylglutamate desuccinylase/aspartoacylase family protein, partial [Aduncisulcus paluster]
MLKSLTCYALHERGIPAMAVEVSKDIMDLGWKVNQQLRATVYLLHEFGLELEVPDFSFPKSQNGQGVEVLINGKPLRGKALSCDRPNLNLLTAPRMALSQFPALEVRIDGNRQVTTNVRWKGSKPDLPEVN